MTKPTAPVGAHLSFTEREYNYAQALKKPIVAFIRSEDSIIATKSDNEPAQRRAMARFRARVKKRYPVKFWSTAEQLGSQVTTAIMEARERHPAEGWIKAADIRQYLGLEFELVTALGITGIVEINPGLGGAPDQKIFHRLHRAQRIDIFANSAYNFLTLNQNSLMEALSSPSCRMRLVLSDTDRNPLFRSRMRHAGRGTDMLVTEALCPSKDVAREINDSIHYVVNAIYPGAQRHAARHKTGGPGRIEVFRYRGLPTCGLMFVDEQIGRLVPYVPFGGSNQSPAFVFSKGIGDEGRLFDSLWANYEEVLECIGTPSVSLGVQPPAATDAADIPVAVEVSGVLAG